MRVVCTGSWKEARAALQGEMPKVRLAVAVAFRAEARFLKDVVVKGMRAQAPGGVAYKPLSPSTLAVRKFLGIRRETALIRTTELIRGIKVTSFGRSGSLAYRVFVGILESALRENGRSLYKDAVTNEVGGKPYVVRITPKMRAFLMAALGNVKALRRLGPPQAPKGFMIVRIPARPTWEPVWESWGKTSAARIMATARMLYKGKFMP